jgi:hypothetical protein
VTITLLAFATRFRAARERPRHWPTRSTGCRRRRRNASPSRSNVGWTTSPTTTASWRRCRPGWPSLSGRRATLQGRRPPVACR